ncbi:MAG: DCC1-like thiol-disulfide oxidoreductase family protein [Gammaproteobacteria bacterium]|nr:DCC1-like thiol-disulfide oxidoreductase family protein [Gammaproteobacteria bacterium]
MIRKQNNAGTDIPIILFDGVCNLCESTVHFVVRRDKNRQFRFASLQSEAAQEILSSYQYDFDTLNSVLLIVDNTLYRKSRAALQIVRRLDGAWPILYYLLFWIPKFTADPVYDFIATRRYKWFGVKSECWIPDDETRERFIDNPAGGE